MMDASLRGLALVCVVVMAACGSVIGPATRDIVRDSIAEGTKRENWDKLREPARELSGEIAKGMVSATATPELLAGLDKAIDQFVKTFLHAAAGGLDADMTPAIARTVRASVDAAIAEMLSDATIQRAEQMTDGLTAAALAGLARGIRQKLGPAMADALDQSLAPAMQRAIEAHLGPALAHMLNEDLTPAIANAAHATSKAAAEGFIEGVNERAGPLIDHGIARLEVAIGDAQKDAQSTLRLVLMAGLGVAVGVLAIVLWQRQRAASAGRDALHLVASQIGLAQDGKDQEAIHALVDRIATAGEGTRGGAYLASHLRDHPSIKVKRASRRAT